MRGALVNFDQFPDYNDYAKRFVSGCLNAYEFNGKIYGLPETITMNLLYYRTDVISYLGIDPADFSEWDRIYNMVLPVLKQNGMDFGYEGGFNTFLYQYGGDYYTTDGKSALDTPQAIAAFKRFTELYRVYEVPVAANFYTRFRSGQMPVGVSSLSSYMLLRSASPELYGKWEVRAVPGTVREDGVLSRASSGATTAAMIMNEEKKDAAWAFLKWYMDDETQINYSNELTATVGASAAWFSANTRAFDALAWSGGVKAAVAAMRPEYIDPRNVVGGYITGRHLENARVRTVVGGINYRESIEISVKDINRELDRKNAEFRRLNERKAKTNQFWKEDGK